MRAVLLAGTGVLAAANAAGEGVTARALLSYQSFNDGHIVTNGFRQTYDLHLERALAEPATLRVFVRAEDFNGATEAGIRPLRSGFRQIQPGGEFFYQLPKLQAQVTYNTLQARSRTGALSSTRSSDRGAARLSWRPDSLPGITLEGLHNVSKDQQSGLDTTDDLGSATLDYEFRHLRLSTTGRMTRYSDSQFGFGRSTNDRLAQASYDNQFFGGKLVTFANAMATESRLEERAGNTTARIPNPVTITRALYSVDDTPLDSRDRPLVSMPPLIDGDVTVNAGISLGPESTSYHNIAFDLGRFAQIDEIRVIVRDGSGNPVRLGGVVHFDAYISDDGLTWTPLRGGARTAFDVPRSYYEVTFALITTRWFKLVNFGVNAEATFVTETEAYYHTELVAEQRRQTNMRFYNGVATLTAQPLRWLSLSYNGLFNSATQRPSDRPLFSTRDADHSGTLQLDPVRTLSLTGRYEQRSVVQTGGLTQQFDLWTALATLRPTTAATLTLEADRQNEDNQGRLSHSDTVVLHSFARVLPSVDFNVDVGRQTQDFITEDRIARRRFVSGVGNVQLLRTLRLLLTTSLQRTTFTGEGSVIEGLPPARDDRSSAELFWRPGPPLAIGARFGWVSGTDVSGTTQRYRVQWYPFAEGTFSIGGTYDEDIDPYANRKSSRMMFTPRWMMNRHAILDLNYTVVKSSGDLQSRQRSFFATLTLMN